MSSIVAFTFTLTETGTAMQLPFFALQNGGVLQTGSANASGVTIGNSSSVTAETGYVMTPGQQVPIKNNRTDALWAIGTEGDTLSVLGV